jgi:hydrogenase maturation protein HypF
MPAGSSLAPDMSVFALPGGFAEAPAVLAMGGELKSSFCLLGHGRAMLSGSMGDLEQADVFRAYGAALEQRCAALAFKPEQIATDMHPDYLSTQMGQGLAERDGIGLISVQHHHAHIAATLAEHAWPMDAAPVLGMALDGLGYGADGTIWGGEFLMADYRGFTRLACFQPVGMPGGTQAIRQPWRNTLAHLHACGWEDIVADFGDTDIVRYLCGKKLSVLLTMLERGLNTPQASSAGRLFDAVAACLGIHRDAVASEGEAAIALERMATAAMAEAAGDAYPFAIEASSDGPWRLTWRPMWQALLTDVSRGVDTAHMAALFHNTLIAAIVELGMLLCRQHDVGTAVLSGGVFQNRLLRQGVCRGLTADGLQVLMPERAPAHDGGLALGQAAVAAARMLAHA